MITQLCDEVETVREFTYHVDRVSARNIDRLAISNSVHWYGLVLRREDDRVLRRLLDLNVEGKRKKAKPERTRKKHTGEESVKVGFRREDALCWS